MFAVLFSGKYAAVYIPSAVLSAYQQAKSVCAIVGICGTRLATIVYMDAKIWTGDPLQTDLFEALGVDREGRVVAAGNLKKVLRYAAVDATHVGLQGHLVTPGFIDAHVHLLLGGLSLTSLDLRPVGSPAEFVKVVEDAAKNVPQHGWILGNGWDHEIWGGEMPTRNWVDRVTGDIPVWLTRVDGHLGLANSAALALAGVAAHTNPPAGGAILRDAQGHPTGVLKDSAMGMVASIAPQPSEVDRLDALQRACHHLLSNGITSVHDMGDISLGLKGIASDERIWKDFHLVRQVAARGELPIRVHTYLPLATWSDAAEFVREHGKGEGHHTWGGMKAFMDGSLGSRTALFHDVYADDNTTAGLQVEDPDWMLENIRHADQAGLQVAVHAIGDRAVDDLLDIYAQVQRDNGHRDRRFRIEHAQHIAGQATARQMAAIGALASVQPMHLVSDRHVAPARLGQRRARWSYAFKTLLDAKVTLAMGSDWTVAPVNPLDAIFVAEQRAAPGTADPRGAWVAEEGIHAMSALVGFTQGSAFAAFREQELGTLKQGAYADFVVTNGNASRLSDVLSNPWEADTRVLMTFVGGECRWGCEVPKTLHI